MGYYYNCHAADYKQGRLFIMFEGRSVIVAGFGSGVDRATAKILAGIGANV